jgi:tRNA 2-thiouridine synthesizing protein A
MAIEHDEKLDVSGKSCPIPIVKTRNKIEEMDEGEVLLTVSTGSGSESDFKGWTEGSDDVKLLEHGQDGDEHHFYVEKV